jgi:hypothetical protein
MRKSFLIAALLCWVNVVRAAESAIPVAPSGGDAEPTVVTKLRVTDCRAVRGFVGAPVDGSLKSGAWDGRVWEYPKHDGGAGVQYSYRDNDGLHLTFADPDGFNAVVVRGGIKAKLVADAAKYDDPATGRVVCEFPGKSTTSRAWFDAPVTARRVSFFDVSDGLIADASFFRVRNGLGSLKDANAEPLENPASKEAGLAAVGVECEVKSGNDFSITVTDPLNPRIELHHADYVATGTGRVNVVCDFPDQVVPAGTKLDVSVTSKSQPPKNIRLTQYQIPVEQARPEALEYRKFLLHALYTPVSEPRPWNVWNQPGDDKKYLEKSGDTGDVLQDRLRPWVRDIVMTLDQCRALDPEGKDDVVRQMHQWMYRKILTRSPGGMPAFEVKYNQIAGVPEWASLVHQAWMQAREVPKWWIEHRMVPTGEFGGLVGDDSDMYGNFAPFPMLERDGVGGMVLDAGARLAELAEKENLVDGMNKESMDPLHAYEEGLNHEALMAYWNYGDPIYLERCMNAARNTEPLTMVTEKGHRHFISNMLGIDEVRKPRPPEREHGTHALMWHPALVAAWYNRNPSAMKWLGEWGDGWLAHMPPGGPYGTDVALPGDATTKSDPEPFAGGWGMTGSAFTFLADLTGDAKFVGPYNDYFTRIGKNAGVHLAELYQMNMLAGGAESLARVKGSWGAVLYNLNNTGPWAASLYATGDKQPFIAAIKKDIEELQRFGYMYTGIECFTDRVFLYPIINPSIAYTGGYTTRNKLNLTYAVSWDGFGTDYAALVTSATPKHLKVLLCNLSDQPITGRGTLWRLEPGEYELTMGPDANEDDAADSVERTETLAVTKATGFAVTLPPKVVQVLELKQTRPATGSIYERADLALAGRELNVADGKITGVVHNIGSKDVADVVVAVLDAHGTAIETKHLGPLAAPLDLKPKTIRFEFNAAEGARSVVVDPDRAVEEVFEGNNRVALPN